MHTKYKEINVTPPDYGHGVGTFLASIVGIEMIRCWGWWWWWWGRWAWSRLNHGGEGLWRLPPPPPLARTMTGYFRTRMRKMCATVMFTNLNVFGRQTLINKFAPRNNLDDCVSWSLVSNLIAVHQHQHHQHHHCLQRPPCSPYCSHRRRDSAVRWPRKSHRNSCRDIRM